MNGAAAFEAALYTYSKHQKEELVRDYLDHSIAESTRNAYDRHWQDFEKFCAAEGVEPLLAQPGQFRTEGYTQRCENIAMTYKK